MDIFGAFFQIMLLLGYIYAHVLIRFIPFPWQARIHIVALLAALTVLIIHAFAVAPALPLNSWKDFDVDKPMRHLFLVLLTSIGLPFVVLSSTSPLLQAWAAKRYPDKTPYSLYSLSNFGSLLALLSYPVFVERFFPLTVQAWIWSTGFILFASACLLSVLSTVNAGKANENGTVSLQNVQINKKPSLNGEQQKNGSWLTRSFRWFFPSFCASLMFLAVTNQLCMNVASVPFLWILPLSIYLVSFIIAFGGEKIYPRSVMLILFPFALAVLATLTADGFRVPGIWKSTVPLSMMVLYFSVSLMIICLVCHGELYRIRPAPSQLTSFYLIVSTGGAMGGFFVSILAPLFFPIHMELRIGVLLCFLAVLSAILHRPPIQALAGKGFFKYVFSAAGMLVFIVLCMLMQQLYMTNARNVVYWKRNFYGVVRCRMEGRSPQDKRVTLLHGNTYHGSQYLSEQKRYTPTTYYHQNSGIGLVFRELAKENAIHAGIVGLGAGILSCYTRPNDRFRYYEINPCIIDVAVYTKDHFAFTYIADANSRGGQTVIVPGDARSMMEKDLNEHNLEEGAFDLLILDAFSSDAIPVHLLTAESFDLYKRLIRPDGVMAIHITNNHLDLATVARRLAHHIGYEAVLIRTQHDANRDARPCEWIIASANRQFLNLPSIQKASTDIPLNKTRLWTDNYSSLISVMK